MTQYIEPFKSLRRVAGRLITVADLDRLQLWGPTPAEQAGWAFAVMESEQYDVAPIREIPLHRYVTREGLASLPHEERVEAVAIEISSVDLVTAALPLADALSLLAQRPWFFVLDGHEINAILTIADLQLPPVSLVVFGFILAIEAGIDAYIDRLVPDTWQELIPDARMTKISAVFEGRQRRNAGISVKSCLDLEARLLILCKSKAMRDAIGLSRRELERKGEDLKRLRDTLAHGGSLIDMSGDAASGLEVAQMARNLADHIWDSLRSAPPRTSP